jgi:hypothetical protein
MVSVVDSIVEGCWFEDELLQPPAGNFSRGGRRVLGLMLDCLQAAGLSMSYLEAAACDGKATHGPIEIEKAPLTGGLR